MKNIKDFINDLNVITEKMKSPEIIDLLKYDENEEEIFITICNRKTSDEYDFRVAANCEAVFIKKNGMAICISSPELIILLHILNITTDKLLK